MKTGEDHKAESIVRALQGILGSTGRLAVAAEDCAATVGDTARCASTLPQRVVEDAKILGSWEGELTQRLAELGAAAPVGERDLDSLDFKTFARLTPTLGGVAALMCEGHRVLIECLLAGQEVADYAQDFRTARLFDRQRRGHFDAVTVFRDAIQSLTVQSSSS